MPKIEIARLDGSSPVQADGTINDEASFYFRGRSGRWQFAAGPSELNAEYLVRVMLGMIQDHRVLVVHGDDEQESYTDNEMAHAIINVCSQQYVAWERRRLAAIGTKEGDKHGRETE